MLGEEERRLALVIAHFPDMRRIVAPYTPDTADGKALVGTYNR
jgi:hypothetical protein